MERKDGCVVLTRSAFEHFTTEALKKVLDTTDGSSPMTSMLVGATATIAYGKLRDVIFGEDNENTDTDTDTETLIF